MSLRARQFYQFGPFRIDPVKRVLSRDRQPISLNPKTFDILLTLVENSDTIVEKEDLMKKVWPQVFVEEGNLTQNVHLLRKALGGSPADHQYIVTVPGRGYRFVAQVREYSEEQDPSSRRSVAEDLRKNSEPRTPASGLGIADSESPLPHGRGSDFFSEKTQRHGDVTGAEGIFDEHSMSGTEAGEDELEPSKLNLKLEWRPQPPAHPPPASGLILGSWGLRPVILAAALTTIALAAAYFTVSRQAKTTPRAAPPRTLAILPFRNLKPDSATDFIGFSLADSIIGRLGYVGQVIVRPSSYVDKYRNRVVDPGDVAKELNVNTLLTGSFLKEGDDIRITTQLIDLNGNQVLWQDRMDLKYDKLLTVQDRVADRIVEGLQLKLTTEEAERLKRDLPQNPVAYEYYLRGLDLAWRNNYRMAVPLLEKSVSLDPNYSEAWTMLGEAYTAYGTFQSGGQTYVDRGLSALKKALALNPGQLEARVNIAVHLMESGKVEQAVLDLREVLRINSNYPLARWSLSEAYRYGGMLEESIAEGEHAWQLDPAVGQGSTLNTYLYVGQYRKFIEHLPTGESARTIFYRGLAHYYLKEPAMAASDFNRAYRLDASLIHAQIGKAVADSIAGRDTDGIELLKKIEAGNPVDGELLYKVAQVYAVLGDRPAALRMLRRSIDQNFFCYPYFVSDPLLESVRRKAEFASLIEQARLRHEEFKRKLF